MDWAEVAGLAVVGLVLRELHGFRVELAGLRQDVLGLLRLALQVPEGGEGGGGGVDARGGVGPAGVAAGARGAAQHEGQLGEELAQGSQEALGREREAGPVGVTEQGVGHGGGIAAAASALRGARPDTTLLTGRRPQG